MEVYHIISFMFLRLWQKENLKPKDKPSGIINYVFSSFIYRSALSAAKITNNFNPPIFSANIYCFVIPF